MPLKEDKVTPKNLLPSCIKINFRKGAVLNSVGLSGPGFFDLIGTGKWQRRTEPFLISFMSVSSTPEGRLSELRGFVSFLKPKIQEFQAPFGVEMNFSCPNVGLHSGELSSEVMTALETAAPLQVPLIPNFGPDVSTKIIWDTMLHPSCDAVSISNTLKWGMMPDRVDWESIWGSKSSPLVQFGGGGMSGSPIFPIVLELVQEVCKDSIPKPLIAGGGIMNEANAVALIKSGASAIKLGTVAMLRPWRVRGIVKKVREMML